MAQEANTRRDSSRPNETQRRKGAELKSLMLIPGFPPRPLRLIHLHGHHGMRDFEPVVRQVAPQFAYQKEVLAPQGGRFIYLGETWEGEVPVLHVAEEGV